LVYFPSKMMKDSRLHQGLLILLTSICVALLVTSNPSWAEEGEETLDLFNAFQQESSTASRIAKPLSQTAENVTVITREQIESINAHTLADILDTVPGITVDHRGGPGNSAYVLIQGASAFHTLVMVDGAPLNGADNYSDISSIPAQIIERVEILKGAASTAWGQALGGVIAVTTKAPDHRPLAGDIFASGGTRETTDSRLELSGTLGNLGYYLSGGYLGSDGLRHQPHSQVNSTTEYAKLTYDLPERGKLWATLLYNHANLGVLYAPALDFSEDINSKELNATLGFSRPLTERLSLELRGRYRFCNDVRPDHLISDGSLGEDSNAWEHNGGTSAKLIWRGEQNLLVLGGEYEHFSWSWHDVAWWGAPPVETLWDKQQDRFGLYLNDTISLGPVSISPGVRYDRINGDEQFSPTLGATWQLTGDTLLRAYTAKGFSLPGLNYNNGPEKVWASQVGMETTAIPYLWFKGTLLRNETWNLQPDSTRHISVGTELNMKTTPVFNSSLGIGWLYLNTTEAGGNKATVYGVPRNTLHLSLAYDDHHLLHGTLIGRHIFWNGVPEYNGQYTGMVWDLFLGATLVKRPDFGLELFFSGHNLFDTNQFPDDLVPNTGRWYEGGVRIRF
jgi:vitamin B12 transporter